MGYEVRYGHIDVSIQDALSSRASKGILHTTSMLAFLDEATTQKRVIFKFVSRIY